MESPRIGRGYTSAGQDPPDDPDRADPRGCDLPSEIPASEGAQRVGVPGLVGGPQAELVPQQEEQALRLEGGVVAAFVQVVAGDRSLDLEALAEHPADATVELVAVV